MVHFKKTNLYIFKRKHVKLKSEKFCCYLANCPLTIEVSTNFSNNPRILILFKMLFG